MIVDLTAAFMMGISGGVHCVTMCGGVASAACSPVSTALPKRIGHAFAFNLGRIATYTLLGALAGTLSRLPLAFLPLDVLRFTLRVVAAFMLVGIGLHLAGITSMFGKVEHLGEPLWRRLAPIAKRLVPARTTLHAGLLGMLWGFVPCGLVYGALALALGAGSTSSGAATMLAFGIGTAPVMTVVASAFGQLTRKFTQSMAHRWTRRVAGIVVLAIGIHQGTLVVDQAGARNAFSLANAMASPSVTCCPGHAGH